MKDPLDTKQRAYEILGVGQNATLDEINKAYAELARKYPARRTELTNAWQRLRRPETRLEEDLWYYAVRDAEQVEHVVVDTREEFPWDPALPPLEVGLEFTDLADGRYRRDFSPIAFREVKLSHLDRYDEAPGATLPLRFDQ